MSAAEVREALAELEAIIAADPANADAELLAAAEELRDAMRDAEEATTAGADAAREDDDVVVAVPGDRDDAADDADAARKRKRVEAGEDAKDDVKDEKEDASDDKGDLTLFNLVRGESKKSTSFLVTLAEGGRE